MMNLFSASHLHSLAVWDLLVTSVTSIDLSVVKKCNNSYMNRIAREKGSHKKALASNTSLCRSGFKNIF